MKQLTLSISGMTCGGCVKAVRNVLGRVKGVREAEVVVGSARVVLDDAESADASAIELQLREAITKAGFVVEGATT